MDETTDFVRRAIEDDDPRAQRWLVARFAPFVSNVVRANLGSSPAVSIDVEDLVEDVFLVMFARLKFLRERDGRYSPVLVRFLLRTTKIKCLEYVRDAVKKRVRPATPSELEAAAPEAELLRTASVLQGVLDQEDIAQVRSALDALPSDRRRVIEMRDFLGRSWEEIAQDLGVSAGAVRMRRVRALEELRVRLGPSFFDDFEKE